MLKSECFVGQKVTSCVIVSAAEWWPRRVEGTYSRYFGRLVGRKT